MSEQLRESALLDQEPGTKSFLDQVHLGLRQSPKSLPCKYFYDERGSQLFDQICELEEYYVTRTELAIMDEYAPQIAAQIGAGVMLIEYGSGSSVKTRILLDHLSELEAYVPVDISRDHLQQTCDALNRVYPEIEVLPVCADFTAEFELPIPHDAATHCAVYFPGSTIGNFAPEDAKRILSQISTLCGTGGGLLIGIDLQKDPEVLEAAYNDAQGVTASFNLNLLRRINRELEADFQLDAFQHDAVYNEAKGRIEISLRSLRQQVVTIGGQTFDFAQDELLGTEHSHKYTVDGFSRLAEQAGLTLRAEWMDEESRFAVLHFAVLG